MSHESDKKIVIVMDGGLGLGVTANRAAVLMSGLASKHPEIIGVDHNTSDGVSVNGFTRLPVSILSRPEGENYHFMIERSGMLECDSFIFLKRAQGLRSYEEYGHSINSDQFCDLDIDAMLIYGNIKAVNKITGRFPVLR